MKSRSALLHALLAVALWSAGGTLRADEGIDFFEKRIRPVLAERCYECHSANAKKLKGGLRLDTRTALLQGGDTGPAFLAGQPDDSLLITAVRYHDKDLRMPPPKDGVEQKLGEATIADFVEWVKRGAPIPKEPAPSTAPHWAFQPIGNPAPPAVRDQSWPKTSVDRFILARLEGAGKHPARCADPRTLIRRITYDLTGLPPTPEEVAEFLRACSSGDHPIVSTAPQTSREASNLNTQLSALINRLLASPAYGEKWGRKWLDVVRYADSAGDNSDYPEPLAWRYRNYVIDAFNHDKPYDEFIREQIAGDIFANNLLRDAATLSRARYAECVTATGYLAVARRFGGAKDDRDFYLTIEDTIDTVGKSVLGLTLGCARCHNHKYDPVTMRDFYGLYGIFASTRYSFPGNEEAQRPRDLVPLVPKAEAEAALQPWQTDLTRLDDEVKRIDSELTEKRKMFSSSEPVALASGDVANGSAQDVIEVRVEMKAGEMLQLTILPKTNYGADSTQLELDIGQIDDPGRAWSLSRDVVARFDDQTGGTRWGAWSLLDVTPAPALFWRFERDVVKTPGLHHWQGAADFPVVSANANAAPVKIINAVFAPHSLVVHPAPAGNVAVAWECPTNGTFSIKGRVIDIDPGGGDGVAWKLERRSGIGKALSETLTLTRSLEASKKKRDAFAATKPPVETAFAVSEGHPANARIHKRGEPKDPGDEVPRKNLDLLGGELVPADSGSGRAALAEWLVAPDNPLTARVMVNRIWQGHFGRGLVTTPNDFGTRGAPPSHPELLDWLATKFIESGWSVKAMHRLIMSSAVYQSESSAASNDQYSTFSRRRLDAEELRDTLLMLSGELDRTPGTGHPFPAENTWAFTQHNPFKATYNSSKRSVYLMTQRIQRHPYLALFDGADTNASTATRGASTVPTQALWFMNNPFVHSRAAAFAKRILAESGEAQRVDFAFHLCFQRAPSDHEAQSASAFLSAYQSAGATESDAWIAYARVLLSSNELLHLD